MLSQVNIPANIYHLILSHAYSTENEEIIGMLIGYWEEVPNNNPYLSPKTIAQVKSISFLTRSDKRKDRVEIAPENLHLAALEAEEYGKKTGVPMMVIGWYHSHPHITVFPSHVDIRTQLSQQLMDQKFFGIILSCFDTNTDKTEKVQITCFQSKTDAIRNTPIKVHVPLVIIPLSKETDTEDVRELYLKLPEHMHDEHKKEFTASNERVNYDMRFSKETQASLPNKMTELYNASVYGQLTTSLVDNMIIPATNLLDLKAVALDKEIKELKAYKEKLLLASRSNSPYKSVLSPQTSSSPVPSATVETDDFLIHLDDE